MQPLTREPDGITPVGGELRPGPDRVRLLRCTEPFSAVCPGTKRSNLATELKSSVLGAHEKSLENKPADRHPLLPSRAGAPPAAPPCCPPRLSPRPPPLLPALPSPVPMGGDQRRHHRRLLGVRGTRGAHGGRDTSRCACPGHGLPKAWPTRGHMRFPISGLLLIIIAVINTRGILAVFLSAQPLCL